MRIVACDDDVNELEELKQQLQEIGENISCLWIYVPLLKGSSAVNTCF